MCERSTDLQGVGRQMSMTYHYLGTTGLSNSHSDTLTETLPYIRLSSIPKQAMRRVLKARLIACFGIDMLRG